MSARRLLEAYYAGDFGDEGPPGPEPLNRRFNWRPPEGSPPSERPEIDPAMADEPVQSRLTPEQLRSLFRNARVAPGQTSPGPPAGPEGPERSYSLKELIPDEELMTPDDVLDVHQRSKTHKTKKGRASLSAQAKRMSQELEHRNPRPEPTARQIVDELLNTHPSELSEGGDDEDCEEGEEKDKKASFLARFKKK